MGRKSILEMTHSEAERFFLKGKSYCNIDLPDYLSFSELLDELNETVKKLEKQGSEISDFYNEKKLKNTEGVNHLLFANKDGKLSWRPLQIIHPFLYVLLVKDITSEQHWNILLERFKTFQSNDKIKCCSIPVEALRNKNDKAEQILQWWEQIEQESIFLSLDYRFSYDTDIADCYGSIYTHSIAWAVATIPVAKQDRDKESLGNILDAHIRNMQFGQTNGIPQGSVLMDFIAEIVLGYVDSLLTEKINEHGIVDYNILRYRDDYKIFVNSPNDGNLILKLLSELIVPYGFKLNSSKTKENRDVVLNSIKPDKMAWFQLNQAGLSLQKQLLLIYQHSIQYPNSGSIVRGLTEFNKRLPGKENSIQIISIIVSIMLHNPRVIPVCCSIISKILKNLDKATKLSVSQKIHNRLTETANSEIAQIWLQRMLKANIADLNLKFNEALCSIVEGANVEIWNNSWFHGNNCIKNLISPMSIFRKDIFDQMDEVILDKEVEIFIHSL